MGDLLRPSEQLGPIWTDRFISARRVPVSFLTYEEILPLLTEPIPDFDMTYASGSLEAIFTDYYEIPPQSTVFIRENPCFIRG